MDHKKNTGREIEDKIHRTGQEKQLRELVVKEKLMPLEKLAVATTIDVCDAVAKKYQIMFWSGCEENDDWFVLAKHEDVEKINEMLVRITR